MKIQPFVENEVSEFISKTQLSEETKQLWYTLLRKLRAADILELHSALLEKPELIFTLSENLTEKIKAIRGQNMTALEQVLQDEKGIIEKL